MKTFVGLLMVLTFTVAPPAQAQTWFMFLHLCGQCGWEGENCSDAHTTEHSSCAESADGHACTNVTIGKRGNVLAEVRTATACVGNAVAAVGCHGGGYAMASSARTLNGFATADTAVINGELTAITSTPAGTSMCSCGATSVGTCQMVSSAANLPSCLPSLYD